MSNHYGNDGEKQNLENKNKHTIVIIQWSMNILVSSIYAQNSLT